MTSPEISKLILTDPHRRWVRQLTSLCLLTLVSCDDSSGTSDFVLPGLEVISPVEGEFDLDGDGLIDVEVMFTDTESGVDSETIELTALGRDLLAEWQVTQRDASGLVVEETVAGLLPAGSIRLELSVSDRVGNEREASFTLDLPAGAFHRSISLPFDPFRRAQDVVMRPDGEVLFAVDQSSDLLMIDPNDYRLLAQPSGPLDDLWGLAFDTQRNRVYAVSFEHPGLAEFDGMTGAFLRLIPTTQGAFTLALSQLTSEIYIPLEIEFEEMNGILSVVDRDAGQEVALIQSGITHQAGDGSALGQHGAELTQDEQRLYVPTGSDGLLVYDPHGRDFIEQIDLLPDDDRLGVAFAVKGVGPDLLVNVFRDINIGAAVYRVEATTGRIARVKDLGPHTDINVGLTASHDGTKIFVSGFGGRTNGGLRLEESNYLLSMPNLVIEARLKGLADDFLYNKAAWHPDGRRVYVASTDFRGNNAIVVYLVRP